MTPGETAYNRWCELINGGNPLHRMTLMTWEQQTQWSRDVWEEIAKSVLTGHAILNQTQILNLPAISPL